MAYIPRQLETALKKISYLNPIYKAVESQERTNYLVSAWKDLQE